MSLQIHDHTQPLFASEVWRSCFLLCSAFERLWAGGLGLSQWGRDPMPGREGKVNSHPYSAAIQTVIHSHVHEFMTGVNDVVCRGESAAG